MFRSSPKLFVSSKEIVRAHGATPATVGIIAGEIVVGLSRGQIEHLTTAPGVRKVNHRDLRQSVLARQTSRRWFDATRLVSYLLNNPGERRSQTAYELALRGSVTPGAPTY